MFDQAGREIASQSFTLQALESRDIPLASLIDERNAYGQIGLRFSGKPLELAAQVVITHRSGHATFNSGFLHLTSFKGSTLAGVSPIGGSSPHSLLALANTSDRGRRINVRLAGRTEPLTIELAAHETRLLPLKELADEREEREPEEGDNGGPRPVGLMIEHDGAPGDVLAHGLLREPAGESTNLHLVETAKLTSTRLMSPALRVLPSQSPLLALNNLTGALLQVTATLHYRLGEESHAAVARTIPTGAHQTVALDLSRDLAVLPSEATEPGLTLSYEGAPGSLVAELLLFERNTRTFVQSTPKDSIGEGAIGLSFPFRLDQDGNTILTLANPSATQEVEYCVFLLYNGKSYSWIEDKTLTPGEVRHIDIRRLRDEQIPGELGELLPPELTSGQLKTVIHNDPVSYNKMIGQSVQVHPGGGTSSFLSCPMCPADPDHMTLSPTSLTGNLGTNQQIYPYIHWDDGTFKVNNNPFAIDWDPANSSVATVSEAWNNFRVQFGPESGSTSIDAEMPNECVYEYDYFLGECVCQYTLPVSTAAQVTTSCPIPSGETTTSVGWADGQGEPAVHNFNQRLTPTSTSFSGRLVSESNASPATDSCWYPNSPIPPASGVSGGTWTVGGDNRWGPDQVGWTISAFSHYQQNRLAMGLPLPCRFNLFQRLSISCPGGSSSVYRSLVVLKGIVSATGASSSRSGVLKGRTLIVQ